MTAPVDSFDLASLRLSSGEGRRLRLSVAIAPLELAGDTYAVLPAPAPAPAPASAPDAGAIEVQLDVSRTTGSGYALRLRFEVTLTGPCMRCLEPAAPTFAVDAREISQPGEDDELDSPYVSDGGELDLEGWARDSLALVLPRAILCRADCAGLCPVCGVDLNTAGPEHHHEPEPDPRWAKLSEIHFD